MIGYSDDESKSSNRPRLLSSVSPRALAINLRSLQYLQSMGFITVAKLGFAILMLSRCNGMRLGAIFTKEELKIAKSRIGDMLRDKFTIAENVAEAQSRRDATESQIEHLVDKVADFFCYYMGCRFGGICVLKDLMEIVETEAIENIEKDMKKALQKMKEEIMLKEEVETVEDILANVNGDNFVFDSSTIAFLEFVFNNFETLIQASENGMLEQAMRDAASDFVRCECKYGMTGVRCDECTTTAWSLPFKVIVEPIANDQ